jgi:hypothetical protein
MAGEPDAVVGEAGVGDPIARSEALRAASTELVEVSRRLRARGHALRQRLATAGLRNSREGMATAERLGR